MRGPTRRRLRKFGYGVFYTMPPRLRRRLVRLAVGKYIVGAVALIRDSEADGPGLLRRGESPIDGCARELAEETGIVLSRGALTPAVPSAVVHHRGRWVDIVFEARVPASQVSLVVDGAEVL